MAQKFYVVWRGRRTGIFTDWPTAQAAVDKFAGAQYKSFPSREEAARAYASGTPARTAGRASAKTASSKREKSDEADAVAVDVKIYCDGACEPNPGNAGSGIAIYRSGILSELRYGLYHPKGTNNTAELNALHHALLISQQEIAAERTVRVLSDSSYALNCIKTWASGWEKKGWRKAGGEIKNLEIIQDAYALYQKLDDEVDLQHVSAHVGTEGNELADRMAMHAVLTREPSLKIYDEPIDVKQILRMRAG